MPKAVTLVSLSSLIFILTASFQCEKPCAPLPLDRQSPKTWLPLQGQKELFFRDARGQLKGFLYRERDTVMLHQDAPCGPDRIDRVVSSLMLNSTGTDSLLLELDAPVSLTFRATLNGRNPLLYYNILSHSGNNLLLQRLKNFSVGSKAYAKGLLLKTPPEAADVFDSLYLADGAGIVGFSYQGVSYTLP